MVRKFYVYLAGACNVGKSTLASILIVEEILHIWQSPDGLIYFERENVTPPCTA